MSDEDNSPKKNEKKNKNDEEGNKKKKRKQTYSTYIYKVLKQTHNDLGISNRSMNICNSMVEDMFNRLVDESRNLTTMNHQKTLTSREIETAVKILFPGELAKHAISEGNKAVIKFNNSTGKKGHNTKKKVVKR